MMVFVILALLLALLAIIFALQNTITVTITFLFWQFTGSLALVLLVALAAGILISFLAYLPSLIRGQLSTRRMRKHTSELESDLAAHKQRLEEAQLKLQGQSPAVQPPDSSTADTQQTSSPS